MDVFVTASIGEYTINHLSASRIRHNTQVGVGLGLSYFITRNLGMGADVYSENAAGALVASLSANLILRLPLGQSGFFPTLLAVGGASSIWPKPGSVRLAPAWNITSPGMWGSS